MHSSREKIKSIKKNKIETWNVDCVFMWSSSVPLLYSTNPGLHLQVEESVVSLGTNPARHRHFVFVLVVQTSTSSLPVAETYTEISGEWCIASKEDDSSFLLRRLLQTPHEPNFDLFLFISSVFWGGRTTDYSSIHDHTYGCENLK